MKKLNILFPIKKKNILNEVRKETLKKYGKEIVSYEFKSIDKEMVTLYIKIEEKWLFVTASLSDISKTITYCEDLSF